MQTQGLKLHRSLPRLHKILTNIISNLCYSFASLLVECLLSFCSSSLVDIFFWKVLKSSLICQALHSHPTYTQSYLDLLMKSHHYLAGYVCVNACKMNFLAAFPVKSEECNGLAIWERWDNFRYYSCTQYFSAYIYIKKNFPLNVPGHCNRLPRDVTKSPS